MDHKIPNPTLERLSMLYRLLEQLIARGEKTVSSTRLAAVSGIAAHSIRKDINCLGEVGAVGSGYDVAGLRGFLGERLGLDVKRKACLVGLGRLGSAIMAYERLSASGFEIVAGFDSSINRLETFHSNAPLFPAFEITEQVHRIGIDLGIIATPQSAAQDIAERLIAGGVQGILNFTPALIRRGDARVSIIDMDLVREMTILSAKVAQKQS